MSVNHHLRPHKLTEQQKRALTREHWAWIRHIAIHAVGGMVIGGLVVIMILYFDVNRIGTMIGRSENRFWYVALMIAGFASTFGMVASGTAIWMGKDRE